MPHKDTKITILGDGGWGTALSLLLADKGFEVALWGAFESYTQEMKKSRENTKFLPGFALPSRIRLESSIEKAAAFSDTIVLAAPSQYMRSVVRKLKSHDIRGKRFVSVAKGIETKTMLTMSGIIKEELGPRVPLAVLSGPTIAREVAARNPGAVSLASKDKKLAAEIRKLFLTDYFTLFVTDDVLGVELGGSVKNVIAIGAGIVDGLGLGTNTQSVLFARGVAEMARLGAKMGARRETFMGLSGLGDLATTCLNRTSRNRSLGEAIGKGQKLKHLLKSTEMVVEGVDTCVSTYALAKKHKVAMPIVEAVYGILFKEQKPGDAVKALMWREAHEERD